MPRTSRPGRLNGPWIAFLASIFVFAGLVAALTTDPAAWFAARPASRPLLVFCAAGLKGPVEAVAREYERRFGVPVQIQFGGSNTLLAQLEVADRGDLYLPADDSYVHTARSKGLVREVLPLATMTPVLVVPEGNPLAVESLDDALTRNLRFAQANPEAAAVGKVTQDALTPGGRWDALKARTTVYKPTVTDVATDVRLGTVDAGIVWDVTARALPGLTVVPAAPLDQRSAALSACVLRSAADAPAALRFARYLAAADRGLERFRADGFAPVAGDPWAEVPRLRLFAGAMLRPAVEETIMAFEQREGVLVERVYNGCGILVAQMKSSEGTPRSGPDVFFACDTEFMTQVKDQFGPPVVVSSNELVILVQKGNPHRVRNLGDLGKPGLRVGVGHEKQCALGVLTQETLRQNQTSKTVMKNVVVQTPTGDMLVNQMRTGSLDAVIAYISNAAGAGEELEAVRVDLPCAVALQPVAVGTESRYPQLASRLVAALRGAESRDRFTSFGFGWRDSAAGAP